MKAIKLPCPLEAEEGKALKDWSLLNTICNQYLIHIANESKTSWRNGKSLKAQGKKKGVSDYFLSYPCGDKHGLWIELKRRDKSLSTVSKEQREWLALCSEAGYGACVAYGAEEAIDAIEKYLSQ
ncbi:VRR-NUC domain containing protein [uncultured Caudovirales phage]|uniref:VRR-NUC domain containing protein n=1 Tax=uncultured Caudovirales phage TaxID=2100421 RepID=A0A6J5QPZ4_9CAUD|nr:VRR-NUC domain containing protein [uncultured Caudovirales phage]CAB4183028.1 VRR-NUC domain containing protein [uncultured Caudovirales phage]CAB4212986.1 VRR-NUC domain containing protein [uncultured Caudovirales phage]